MGREEVREFGCDGKERFGTMALAQRVARGRRKARKGWIDAYACRFCRGFHVGNNQKPRHERRR